MAKRKTISPSFPLLRKRSFPPGWVANSSLPFLCSVQHCFHPETLPPRPSPHLTLHRALPHNAECHSQMMQWGYHLFFLSYSPTCTIWKLPARGRIRAAAAGLRHSHNNSNTGSLTHWARPRIEPTSSQRQCRVLNQWSHSGNSGTRPFIWMQPWSCIIQQPWNSAHSPTPLSTLQKNKENVKCSGENPVWKRRWK